MTEYLPPQELHQLTGFARPTGQSSWLKANGIPHRLVDRRVIVSRIHVQSWLEGRNMVSSSGLNLAAIK